MNTLNIQFYDKIRKFPNIFFYLLEEFRRGLKKRVRISHGKRAIDVRTIITS